MVRPHCPARKLLTHSCRPNIQTSQIATGLCPMECIFCDIWQLASLVQSYTPHSPQSRCSSPNSSRTPSPSSDLERSLRSLEQQFQIQKARLASILSICVVEGADESQGLRLAHDRCLSTVTSLLNQRAVVEQLMHIGLTQKSSGSPLSPVQSSHSQRRLRRESGSCGLRDSYLGGRRNSQMGVAV
jgi:hypothetical protein